MDLNLRGEGDILGASQSGARSSLKLLRVLSDHATITKAYELAKQMHEKDPDFNNFPGLKYAIRLEIEERKKEFFGKT